MKPYFETKNGKLYNICCLEMLRQMPDNSVDWCITSPPYWGLRSYLPDVVKLKNDAPEWVIEKLAENNILPIDHIVD